jgi:L-ribulose-5-phosphate 3-epimerase UlaE
MFSGDGEMVPFCEVLYPTGNVEDWLLEVERVMRLSIKKIIEDSLKDYKEVREGLGKERGEVEGVCSVSGRYAWYLVKNWAGVDGIAFGV